MFVCRMRRLPSLNMASWMTKSALVMVGALVGCGGSNMPSMDLSMPPADMSMVATPDMSVGSLVLVSGQLGGSGNVDGTGAAARFGTPSDVASDGAGNLYVVDQSNNTIRKIVLATGVVTTLAGTPGTRGSADGTGPAAQFWHPRGIVSDGVGNLLVSDTNNNTIRKIVIATGAVTTVAGTAGTRGSADGTGAAASFYFPLGLATDGTGNLYVADQGNSTIRKIVLATGVVTTLAGTATANGLQDGTGAAALFSTPSALAADGAGNLYVADTGNCAIRQIVIATAVVTTLSGGTATGGTDGLFAAATFNFPTGITSDGAGNLFVSDTQNQTIRKLTFSTGKVSTFAGTTGMLGGSDGIGSAALFNSPTGLTNAAGDLYVADWGSATVRKVATATAAVSTVAGTAKTVGSADGAAARFFTPAGVAADGAGNLYVADSGNQTIRKIASATNVVSTLAGSPGISGAADGTGANAQFFTPTGLATDGTNLYVTDWEYSSIRKVVIATGAVTTLAGGGTGSADGTGIAARFRNPDGLAADGAGNLYIADTGNDTIRQLVIATGVVTTLAGTARIAGSADGTGAAARFYKPVGIAADRMGNLYVADALNATIRKIVIATAAVTTVAGTAGMSGTNDGIGTAAHFAAPNTIVFDGSDSLFVADGNTVRRISIATATVSTSIGVAGHGIVQPGLLPASLSCPYGLAMMGADVAITDPCENVVLIAQHP
jgi:sugar lactone lactonase YvrE